MAEKIGEIKEKLKQWDDKDLAQFLAQYQHDDRSGVVALCNQAIKRMAAYEKELARMETMMQYERQFASYGAICGIDEVGRGPLAGPVVAGAVILPKDCDILYLNDSKQLSAKMRDRLYDEIMEKALATGIGYASEKRIDEINILNATYEAMREAIGKCGITPDILLNDAVTIPGISIRQVPIIKGDAQSASIAAASIIAKVTRDRLMEQMDEQYPGYGFASNKGYGSGEHIAALKKLGPCAIHRKTFIGHFVSL
jgi:ribonuclease HII